MADPRKSARRRFSPKYGTPMPSQRRDSKVTPRSHPLFSKGWTKLPITSYELPDAQAVPA